VAASLLGNLSLGPAPASRICIQAWSRLLVGTTHLAYSAGYLLQAGKTGGRTASQGMSRITCRHKEVSEVRVAGGRCGSMTVGMLHRS